MKNYLLETFRFNDNANRRMISKIRELPEKEECIRLISHLVNCQYKWMARLKGDPAATKMSWWEPLYALDDLGAEWEKSLQIWIDYLEATDEQMLREEVQYVGTDGDILAATPWDIALQLNYHSIHHRAQMQMLIRNQGAEPDFIDYIATKYRKIGPVGQEEKLLQKV